jgi:hypothetical protein
LCLNKLLNLGVTIVMVISSKRRNFGRPFGMITGSMDAITSEGQMSLVPAKIDYPGQEFDFMLVEIAGYYGTADDQSTSVQFV